MSEVPTVRRREFPTVAGILFGLGLGGFFDGIVLHQLLQWHNMLSGWFPPDSIDNLRLNILWDGLFHSATYLLVLAGLFVLWRTARRSHLYWSNKLLFGTLLLGFGAFNVVEGLIDHQVLGVHHVNETVPPDQVLVWDVAFLVWGAAMFVAGLLLWRSGRAEFEAREISTAAADANYPR